MARLPPWLEARWYGGRRPGLGLGLLEVLYSTLTAARRGLYRLGWWRSARLPVPVLVVGNLTVGGSGKTPLVIALCAALQERGWRPGVVSRGYGRKQAGTLRVSVDSTAETVGDEPLLIAQRSGCPVAVSARRAEAGRLLLAGGEVDLLIADDGLQHYALERDVEVLVIDGERRFGNGRLLPAGPLREPPWRAARCTARVVNGGLAGDNEVPMRLELGEARPLAGGELLPLDALRGRSVQAVAGIGHPPRFFRALREAGLEVEAHAFDDHHAFSESDFAFDDGRPLLMTEKDAAKCRGFARPHWYSVGATANLPADFFDTLNALLLQAKERLDG
ncbi:tetraacyldisaccharide 4'-kinase [Pseudomarimonas salicorniae]|uniref:Tetraacyldisaccharide 4'-kinase n=1 Tax=Pseudomarimonas salicorniae TaxID=2933270 RepID=A0ABT0GFY8_9GAMM|nr:tetraacyldisaccharide 4'-kinase [Lysobacter sp. CAU 1642]MCK7592962.1 tetraacyldisaccharide 4'-kinase [Lysobacter sp. CAU 1642]